jgi:fatty acid amide hydrolase 2
MNELLTMSVVEMAKRVRKGGLSPVELLDVHIKRIQDVNPYINAVIEERFEQARAEAKSAAEKLAQGRENLPPLFGIPCTIKDTFAVKDMKWAVGVWARKDLVADWDAVTVKRLKDAGAIIMGKTNVPEAAMWCETYNHVYGRTKNPYDLRRGAGGSSGGEGAIVAASGSPFGLGADVGGSIRYPSAFNGVAGHKPSGRLVPGTGHWPPAHGPLAAYNSFGPICRRVSDLAYILPLIAGPDGVDQAVEKRELKSPDSVDISKLKVFCFDYNGQAGTNADVVRAIGMAAGAFAGMKVPTEYWRPQGVNNSLDIWQAGMAQNPEPFKRFLEGDEPLNLWKEAIRFLFRESKITFPALGSAIIEKPSQLMKWRNSRMLRLAADIQQKIESRLGDSGVLICPVFSTPAPRHSLIWLNFMGIGYSGLINILEFPSTIIPIFHKKSGLPVSVQIVSGRGNDHLTLAAAQALEQIYGGWKPIERIRS